MALGPRQGLLSACLRVPIQVELPGTPTHPQGHSYPSSAPDTMCSSLMSWMQSMEPLEEEQ